MTLPAIIPAATLILFDDREDADALHLMVERAASMAFAAGALVFPGGRVDDDDRAQAAHYPALDPVDAAARIAAIRETLEETGVAAGFAVAPDADTAAMMRTALHQGEAFSGLIERHALALDLDAIIPFAHWRPPQIGERPRIFDTRFFIACAPADAQSASVDATENTRLMWASAAGLLARAAKGEAHIIHPTQRNLERLATIPSFAAACAHLVEHPVRLVMPRKETRDGVDHLVIDGGIGYPFTAMPLTEVKRG